MVKFDGNVNYLNSIWHDSAKNTNIYIKYILNNLITKFQWKYCKCFAVHVFLYEYLAVSRSLGVALPSSSAEDVSKGSTTCWTVWICLYVFLWYMPASTTPETIFLVPTMNRYG